MRNQPCGGREEARNLTPESLRVVVQHLAQLLFGHAGGAEQDQHDFGLQGFGLGERPTGRLADTWVDGRGIRHRHHRHGFALAKIGGDPGREQPVELLQGLLRRLPASDTVVQGNGYGADPLLAVPGDGRQAVRDVFNINGDGVQSKSIGGRVFLRKKHLRSQREVGDDLSDVIALYNTTGKEGQFSPVAAGLRWRNDDGEGGGGDSGSFCVHECHCTNWPHHDHERVPNPAAVSAILIPARAGIQIRRVQRPGARNKPPRYKYGNAARWTQVANLRLPNMSAQ